MSDKTFRPVRGLSDKELDAALTNHARELTKIAHATTMLLRERRVFLAWIITVTVTLVWLVLGR